MAKLDPYGRDLILGVQAWRIWMLLGWSDIRQRYRRSVIGPLWITLSMALLIIVLGFLYSRIFHTDIRSYLPYIALGFIVWGFILSSVNESCEAFSGNERIIKQIRTPISIFVFRVIWRNFIILLHTIGLIVPIWLIFRIKPTFISLLAIPGLFLVFCNLIWIGHVLAFFSSRYRDVPPIVQTFMQIAMFATPIMWPVSSLGGHDFVAKINPLYHLIEIVRAPLSERAPEPMSWVVAIGMLVIGTAFALWVQHRVSRWVVYWL